MKRKIRVVFMVVSLLCACSLMAETKQQYLMDAFEISGDEGIQLAPGVVVGVVVEVDAAYERQSGRDSSSLKLSTLELGIDANLIRGVSGTMSLLWEQDETEPMEIDMAYIVLGGTDSIPPALSAGRMYLPFGFYNSMMISDSMPLELGETRQTTVGLEYSGGLFFLWAGAFAGGLENSERIEKGVVAAVFEPTDYLAIGGGYLSDIAEGGYQDFINEILNDGGDYRRTGAWNVFLALNIDPFSLNAEYVGSAGEMKITDAEGEQTGMKPQTWSAEIGLAATEKLGLALRYEGSSKFKPDEMPKNRYGGVVAYEINRFTVLSLEYLYGRFAEDTQDAHQMLTTRLALVF